MTLLEAINNDDEPGKEAACKKLFANPKVVGQINKMRYHYNVLAEPADEILQEGMIRMYENILFGKFRGDSLESTYLVSICHNYIRNKLKKTSKESKTDYKDDFGELPLLNEEDLSVSHPSDLNMVDDEAQLLKEILKEEKNKLSEKCQEALTGYYEKGLTMALLAEKINLKNRTQAKKKVHTCREHLRKAVFNRLS